MVDYDALYDALAARPPARRHARDLRRRAAAARLAAAAARQRHPHPAHRRRVDHARSGIAAGMVADEVAPLAGGRAAAEPVLNRNANPGARGMKKDEKNRREAIVEACRWMNATRASTRAPRATSACAHGDAMLITPSGVPYDQLEPDDIVAMPLHGEYGAWAKGRSSRPRSGASTSTSCGRARTSAPSSTPTRTYCTALACRPQGRSRPCHYMIAACGRPDHPLRRLRDLRHRGAVGRRRWRRSRAGPAACSPTTA